MGKTRRLTLVEAVMEHLLGRKYYANIIHTEGTHRCEMSCYIFHTRDEARQHKEDIDKMSSFSWVETVSFRSRQQYARVMREKTLNE